MTDNLNYAPPSSVGGLHITEVYQHKPSPMQRSFHAQVHPERPQASSPNGCMCRENLCSSAACACHNSGSGCRKDCFCNDFHPDPDAPTYLEMVDDCGQITDDNPEWKPGCANVFNFIDNFGLELNADLTPCFEPYVLRQHKHILHQYEGEDGCGKLMADIQQSHVGALALARLP
ncbi:hypothetical protein K469DRAFT_88214 [Zopfia rhizophila CBS 207.26]|uniref:Tesmin/TSO1-like CXC domain-containing protein n=1 Tax=Zopfia rhizophila CBS 207.26 TaxID=1314779 RepID=A0A6A6D7G9_9PEZI|nr:hypothetical protein K469DRAFT_88214 [Zopfia rhizophila CBS 207.26]